MIQIYYNILGLYSKYVIFVIKNDTQDSIRKYPFKPG